MDLPGDLTIPISCRFFARLLIPGIGESNIDKFLEDFYLLAYGSLGRKGIKEAIVQCKLESKQEGTDNLPDNFGDFLIEQAKGNNEKYLKIVNNAILGGANDDDIRQWWKLNDLERRMMLWED